MLKQKIKEEIENNLAFRIDRRNTFALNSTQKASLRNPSHKNNICLYSISVFFFFNFGLFIKTTTKQTVYRTISLEKADLDCNF